VGSVSLCHRSFSFEDLVGESMTNEQLEETFAPISKYIAGLERDLAEAVRFRQQVRDEFEAALRAKDEEIAKLKARTVVSTTVLLSDLARIFELAPRWTERI